MGLSTFDDFKRLQADGAIALEGGRLDALQHTLSAILDDLLAVAKETGARLMLGGGTALGAVRHGGFIPWDDDLDVNLPRADWPRFRDALLSRFPSRYAVFEPGSPPSYGLAFPRVRLRGTCFVTREDLADPPPSSGVFVDVFLFEDTPDAYPLRLLHGAGSMVLGLLYSCRKAFAERTLQRKWGLDSPTFRLKRFIGALISFLSLGRWTRLWDWWNQLCHNPRSKFMTCPVGRRHYFGELALRSSTLPPVPISFAGRDCRIAADAAGYMTRLYGPEYMTPPPPALRERHVVFPPFVPEPPADGDADVPRKKLLLLAGEESGLIYAQRLMKELDGCEFRTYQDFYRTSDLAVMGFWPVLRRIFFFLGVQRTMKRLVREWRPDAVVTIDYPGLNLKLAAYAKSLGIPAVHIVCPQVWAWHRDRIPKVAAALNRLLCFFPFEPALFNGTGKDDFKAEFIGHPLADIFAEETTPDTTDPGPLLAILPGSRTGEIVRNLPRLMDAVKLLGDVAGLRVEIPAANPQARQLIERIVRGAGTPPVPVSVTLGGARALLRRARCAAVASGTATLEAALARCPTVLVYAVSPLLAWFARRVITGVRHIGLANVMAEKQGTEPPMPELLQEEFTPQAVASRLRPWLDDPSAREEAVRALDATVSLLHSGGNALALAADVIRSAANTAPRKECGK